MKKYFLQLSFITLTIIASQNAWSQDVGFGIKGGLNLANLKVDDPEATYNSRTGYHAGIFIRGKFNKIAIQPEVLISTQRNLKDMGTLGTVENSFTYLSVPVMIKFYPISGLNLQVGPQFGFLLDGEQKYKTTLFTGTRDIKDSYDNSDVSISLGTGFDFPFGLGIDFRYNIGVKDINNEANGEEAKSQLFMLSLGWNFIK
ncbi:MAG: porin family protein [Chryseolinea sp.]